MIEEVRPLPFRAILVVLGAAALPAGCGGPEPVTDNDGVLRVTVGDPEYAITPGAIRVRAGSLKIVARNTGTLTHNVRVEEVVEEEAVVAKTYAGTETMQPGQAAPSVTLRLFPGRYRLVCSIGNHENLGQYADLEVTDADEG